MKSLTNFAEALISAWGSFTCHKSTTRDPRLYKEVILRIFTLWKNPSTPARFEPTNPNIWQKVKNKGVTILKVHKCCTPVNKAMPEISNCCQYFFNPTLALASKRNYNSLKLFSLNGSLCTNLKNWWWQSVFLFALSWQNIPNTHIVICWCTHKFVSISWPAVKHIIISHSELIYKMMLHCTNSVCVCSNANPLHYYVLRVPRKVDRRR